MSKPFSDLINKIEEYKENDFKFSFKAMIYNDQEISVENNLVYAEIEALSKEEYSDFELEDLCYPKIHFVTKLIDISELITFILQCELYSLITRAKTKKLTLTKEELKKKIDSRISNELFENIYNGKTNFDIKNVKINLAYLNPYSDCDFDETDPFDYSRSYDSSTFYYKIDFSAGGSKNLYYNKKLYTLENPYYASYYDLIKQKFGKDLYHKSTGALNSIYVILPQEHIGKIRLELKEEVLIINILREISEDLFLKLQLKNTKLDKLINSDLQIKKGSSQEKIVLEFIPEEIKGILINSQGKIIQKIVEIPNILQAGILTPNLIKEIISDGEGLKTEFKLEYPKKSGKLNPDKIRKDICALANCEGGLIIFGVDEEAEIKGYNYELNIKTLDAFDAHIQDICNEDLNPPVEAAVREMIVEGKTIVIVKIEKNQYYVRLKTSKEPYFRKGSTSRKAKPFDLKKSDANVSSF